MKKILPIAIAVSMLLFACKKKEMTPSVKKYQVNFSLNTFKSSATTFAVNTAKKGRVLAAAAIPVSTRYLTALFYDKNSVLLERVDQYYTDSNFGTISASLPAGTVYAFFIATDDNSFQILLQQGRSNTIMPNGYPLLHYEPVYTRGPGGVPMNISLDGPTTTELYTAAQTLSITAASSQSITLTRAASTINVIIHDIQPQGIMNFLHQNATNGLNLLDQGADDVLQPSIAYGFFTADQEVVDCTFYQIVWPGVLARTNSNYQIEETFPPGSDNSIPQPYTKTLFSAQDTIKAGTHYTFEGYMNKNNFTTTVKVDTTWTPINKTLAKH